MITFISPNKYITLEVIAFSRGPEAIKWKNQGLVRYLSKDRVANILDILIDRDKRGWLNPPPESRVYWSDCEDELSKDTDCDEPDEQGVESTECPKD